MDLGHLFSNPWVDLISQHRKGRARKQDFIDLLRSGEPIPPECNGYIADIIEGKTKFRRGQPKGAIEMHLSNYSIAREGLISLVDKIQSELEDKNFDFKKSGYSSEIIEYLEGQSQYIRNTGTSGRPAAKDFVAEMYGFSTRTLEKFLKRQ
ncbi:MAG: hypothetical protein ACQEUM_02655 [Pseudomonadota bacterium]